MYYIGLDLSINYSSFTVSKDFKEFKFGSIINDTGLSMKKKNYFDELTFSLDGSFTLKYTNRSKKSNGVKSYTDNERDKLVNYIEVSNLLCNTLNDIIEYNQDVIIGIEGMAFGAQGMAVFDIPFLTGIIRRDLLVNVLKSDVKRLFIFSPSELKNTIGCKGNAKKGDIYNMFLQNPGIESVKEDFFYQYILKNGFDPYIKQVNEKNGEVHIGSPFNDIIDSYLPVLKFYKELNPDQE